MTLHLPLKREYFEAVKAGTKVWEYRLYNNYWRRRIANKDFDTIVLTLGYPKRNDKSRRIERPWRGFYTDRITHPQFGKDSVKVFAIKVN